MKSRIESIADQHGTKDEKLRRILFKWQSTPTLATGRSPDELFLGRKLRIKLDLVKPPQKHSKPCIKINGSLRSFSKGERVQSRLYTGKVKWKYGIIEEQLGNLHYLVRFDDGTTEGRHINQLRSIKVPLPTFEKSDQLKKSSNPKTVTFAPLPELRRSERTRVRPVRYV